MNTLSTAPVRETGHVAGRLATAYALDVCTDCLSVLVNGASTEDEERAAMAMHARHDDLGTWGIGWFISLGHLPEGCDTCDGEGEECGGDASFSWSQCDACGSSLGGARHPATLWVAIW